MQTTLQQPKPKHPGRPYTVSLVSEVERPDRISPASNSDSEPQLRRVRLTRKNLAQFDRTAKKKGIHETIKSTSPNPTVEPSTTKTTLTTKTTSTTLSGFAIQAHKNGILNPFKSEPPTNIDDIRERVARSRGSVSPTESDHNLYVKTVVSTANEATLVVKMSRKLLKEYDHEGYQQAYNQAFTGFPKDVGFNNGLSVPQPDLIEGLPMEDYESFPIDEYVKGAVVCKDDPQSLTLPHFAGEWKGRGKNMEEARLQSAYDGAALVFARKMALSHLGKADPPGHSEITTFTTDGTNLNLFAHYAAPSGDGTLKYHQHPIKTINLLKSHEEYNEGRRSLRNSQENAKEQAFALRDQLEAHWKKRGRGLYPITKGDTIPDEAAPCEDEAGYEIVWQPCQPTPAASSNYTPGAGSQKRKATLSSQESSNGFSEYKSKYSVRVYARVCACFFLQRSRSDRKAEYPPPHSAEPIIC